MIQDENSDSCEIHILHVINEWLFNGNKHERVKYEEG
jgi:hypothetical protein